jgi:hypothetical protein
MLHKENGVVLLILTLKHHHHYHDADTVGDELMYKHLKHRSIPDAYFLKHLFLI